MSLGRASPRDAGGDPLRTVLFWVYASTVLGTRSRRFGPLLLPERRCRTPLACGTGWSFRCLAGVRPGVCRRLICVEFRGSPVFPTGPAVEPARGQNRQGSTRTGGQRRGGDAADESFAVAWADRPDV